ncbi:hypothetical protein TNCV_1292861 [Trichonephila clavipes]|nr:hypothetical protein TNCV_1292861 [Trichonephila clavipes]
MDAVDILHHAYPPTWAGVKPTNLGVQGQRQSNYATQPEALWNVNLDKQFYVPCSLRVFELFWCDAGRIGLVVKVFDLGLLLMSSSPVPLKTA